MDLTEEKTKHILDFLAKRIGFDEICVCPVPTNICQFLENKCLFTFDYLVVCKHFNSSIRYVLCFDAAIKHPIYVSSSSSADVLEKLLKFSRRMKENIYCGSSKRIFLRHDTSLEEILIEMDLSRYE